MTEILTLEFVLPLLPPPLLYLDDDGIGADWAARRCHDETILPPRTAILGGAAVMEDDQVPTPLPVASPEQEMRCRRRRRSCSRTYGRRQEGRGRFVHGV